MTPLTLRIMAPDTLVQHSASPCPMQHEMALRPLDTTTKTVKLNGRNRLRSINHSEVKFK